MTDRTDRTERIERRIDDVLEDLAGGAKTPAELRDLSVALVALSEAQDGAAEVEGKVIVHADVMRRWRESIRRLLGELTGQDYEPDADHGPRPRTYELDVEDDLVVGQVNELRLRLADAAELIRKAREAPRAGHRVEGTDEIVGEPLALGEDFLTALDHALAGDPGHIERDEWQEDRRTALERHAGSTLRLGEPATKVTRGTFYAVKEGVLYELEDRVA